MTLEEAKKILKKEGFHLFLASKVINQTGAIREFEKPEVCEAIKVANANKWTVGLSPIEWDEREALLKEEYEKNHIKCGEPIPGTPLGAVEGKRLRWKDNNNTDKRPKEGNPALKEAASQFNDALLDEQAKQINKQNKEITRLLSLVEKKENSISRLYYEKSVLEKENEELKKGEIPAKYFDKALVDEQAEKIKNLEHEKLDILEMASSCKQTVAERGKEIARLNNIIHKKNLKIEELKKERSEHLAGEVKFFGETVDLSQELCDKNEELRLSKIREKNLTEVCQKYMKENEELKKELADKVVDKIDAQALKSAESALAWKEKVVTYKDMALAYYEKKINEKDEVIADLGKELEATKNELEEKNYLMDMLRCGSREYCEYGIAAEKMIQKMAKVIVEERAIDSEDIKEYRRLANGYRFNPQLPDFSEEEEKKFSSAKDNHPTEDNPEEVKMEEILEHVRKVLEKGGTVTTSYDKAEEGGDKSATIVQHGKSIVDLFKEIKHLWQ